MPHTIATWRDKRLSARTDRRRLFSLLLALTACHQPHAISAPLPIFAGICELAVDLGTAVPKSVASTTFSEPLYPNHHAPRFADEPALFQTRPAEMDGDRGRWIRIRNLDVPADFRPAAAILTNADRPLAAYALVAEGVSPADSGNLTFQRIGDDLSLDRLRGPFGVWLIADEAISRLGRNLPADAGVFAKIQTVGPANRNAWIDTGARDGINVGDAFWVRVRGQPIARLDVQVVDQRLSSCSLTSLAEPMATLVGRTAELWPAPGCRLRGRAISAVCSVEIEGDKRWVRIARPRGVKLASDIHVHFERDGAWIGQGVVERQSAEFWTVAYTAFPSLNAVVTPPETQPAGAMAVSALRVGDLAHIRTLPQIEEGKFVGLVFEISPKGPLVDAGETERLRRGDIAQVVRDRRPLCTARVQEVRRLYSTIQYADDSPPALGDEVYFGPLPQPPTAAGIVDRVIDEQIVEIARLGPAITDNEVVAIRRGGATIAAVIIAGQIGDSGGWGVVIPRTAAETVRPGDELIRGISPDANR